MPDTDRRWPDKPRLWRWHFYAGLFCIPFVLWLSITGSIYLFRPQVEAWLDRPYAAVATTGPRASAAAQAAAAVRAVPGSVLHRYELPQTAAQAVQILVGRDGRETRVYVHPQTLAILKTVAEDARPMRIVFRLHGELLAGTPGSWLVELAASWTIVMILTGLALWWPNGRGAAGTFYPRLRSGGRRFWRDLHAVTGVWVSLAALFLLVSGLPWAKSWGSYLTAVRTLAERRTVVPDWPTGGGDAGTRAMMGAHAEHGGMAMAHRPADPAALDRVVAAVAPLGLAAPVLVAPPTGPHAPWTAKSDAADRPLRAELTIDGATGRILTRTDFAQRRAIDRVVGYGIAVHEGQLFGWLNQLLNLLTAAGLATVSAGGIVLWWRRRPTGRLGAPPPRAHPRLAIGCAVLIGAMAILLPLFGTTLVAVLTLDALAQRGRRRGAGGRARTDTPCGTGSRVRQDFRK